MWFVFCWKQKIWTNHQHPVFPQIVTRFLGTARLFPLFGQDFLQAHHGITFVDKKHRWPITFPFHETKKIAKIPIHEHPIILFHDWLREHGGHLSPHPDPCTAHIMQFKVFIFPQLGLFLRSRGASTDINPNCHCLMSQWLKLSNVVLGFRCCLFGCLSTKVLQDTGKPLLLPTRCDCFASNHWVMDLVLEYPLEVEHQSFAAGRQTESHQTPPFPCTCQIPSLCMSQAHRSRWSGCHVGVLNGRWLDGRYSKSVRHFKTNSKQGQHIPEVSWR